MKNRTAMKKDISALLILVFSFLNTVHIIFPVWLIIEDVKNKSMHGTGMEIAVMYPWIIEILSVPAVVLQIIYYLVLRREKHFSLPLLLLFVFYVFQIILFNLLLMI